jgi:hypothetical protein
MYNYQSVYCMRCPCSIKCSTSTLLMKWKESWESRTVSPSLVRMSPQSFTTRIWMKRSIGGSMSYLAEKDGNRRNSGYEGVSLGFWEKFLRGLLLLNRNSENRKFELEFSCDPVCFFYSFLNTTFLY